MHQFRRKGILLVSSIPQFVGTASYYLRASMKGIIIHSIAYGDYSRIAHILLETEGLKSFMVRKGKGNRSKNNHLLAPLTIVELEAHLRENANIHNLTQLNSAYAFQSIPFDPVKASIALFCSELLHKTLHNDYINVGLFKFICNSAIALDQAASPANFPIAFLCGLCSHYGFEIQLLDVQAKRFDLASGEISSGFSAQPSLLNERECAVLAALASTDSDVFSIAANQTERRNITDTLIAYLKQHLDMRFEIKSTSVLHEVFSD